MSWIRRKGRNLAREHHSLPARRPRTAFMRVAAVQDNRGAVERRLKEFLVGIIAYRFRHLPLGVGNHAVTGNDDVTLDAAQRLTL